MKRVRVLDSFDLLVDPTARGLEADIAADGIREPHTTRAYRAAIRDLPPEPVILDIGANIGYYAIQPLVMREDARVIAIEPYPDTVAKLRENVKLNGVADRIDIHEVACGAAHGTQELYLHSNANRHSMSEKARRRGDSIEVPVKPVDDIVKPPRRIDAVRMDVEGYEGQVIRGMPRIFDANDGLLCNIEFHSVLMDAADIGHLHERFVGYSSEAQTAQADRDLGMMPLADVLEWDWIEAVFRWWA